MDRYLDTTQLGPMYLKRPELAQLVVKALHHGRGKRTLRAARLRSNEQSRSRLAPSPKQQASRVLRLCDHRPGSQPDPGSHRQAILGSRNRTTIGWKGTELELERIVAYIENNPVQDWPRNPLRTDGPARGAEAHATITSAWAGFAGAPTATAASRLRKRARLTGGARETAGPPKPSVKTETETPPRQSQ